MDLFEAADARDRALKLVSEHAGDFMQRGEAAIRALPAGWRGTGEELRLYVEALGIEPHHHNAWGALIRVCVTAKWIRWTGEHEHMKTAKSHARLTPVYRRAEAHAGCEAST